MPPLQEIYVPGKVSYLTFDSFQSMNEDLTSSPLQDFRPRYPRRKQSIDVSDHSTSIFGTQSSASDTTPRKPKRRVSLDFVKTAVASVNSDTVPTLPCGRQCLVDREYGGDSDPPIQRRHTYHESYLKWRLASDAFECSDDLTVDTAENGEDSRKNL